MTYRKPVHVTGSEEVPGDAVLFHSSARLVFQRKMIYVLLFDISNELFLSSVEICVAGQLCLLLK